MRHESRTTERRAPITPWDAGQLVRNGLRLTVEDSPQRVFPLADYVDAGCVPAPMGSWTSAPDDEYVIGLEELPHKPAQLRHRHIYFGHAYKGQPDAVALLYRFAAGGGTLFDLEHVTDGKGVRRAAFGYWAGYVGAGLAILRWWGRLTGPLEPLSRDEFDARLREAPDADARAGQGPTAIVVGALGRSGRGACDALEAAGVTPVRWDATETRNLDRDALLGHDIFINAVLTTHRVPPFLTEDHLKSGHRLSVISDITCDVGSELSVLPFNDAFTDWLRPVRSLRIGDKPLDVIAIDNLPSLLPTEASEDFSAALTPHLLALSETDPVWARCREAFTTALAAVHDRTPAGCSEAAPDRENTHA
ncbi:saccharopine dehydrogenase [Streptomyces sp. NPDC005808]|uniref:saccharopine dehydrogenase n=1 Tax=Streptomyces sp. NPDC005808 TaxID=3364734 RepID=UPI0036880D0A